MIKITKPYVWFAKQ